MRPEANRGALCSDGAPTVYIVGREAQASRSRVFGFVLSQFLGLLFVTTTTIRFAHSESSNLDICELVVICEKPYMTYP
jgi:hypothetical protein